VVWCENDSNWSYKLNGSERSAGSLTMDLKFFSGKTVDVYIGFMCADGKEVSDSLYLGKVDILNEKTS
jgi:hypothetical protein